MIELPVINRGGEEADGPRERYWRSIADLRNDPELRAAAGEEFMAGASDAPGGASRRQFLQIMGASMAMTGLAACRRPIEKTLPYARQPEEIIPGEALYYATAMPFRGVVHPLLVESHEGRPTKIEGNPEHPMSEGATSVFDQASILNLYDPDRSHRILRDRSEATWQDFLTYAQTLAVGAAARRVVVLAEPSSSPTLQSVRSRLQQRFPQLQWITYRAEGDEAASGAGRPLFKFSAARVIVSLDADFLGTTDPNVVYNTAEFARGRRIAAAGDEPNRLYVFESNYTLTGGMADHRKRVRSSDVHQVAQAIASGLGASSAAGALANDPIISAAVADLRRAGRNGLVVAGPTQPAAVHALAESINRSLGGVGTVVNYLPSEGAGEGSQAQRMAGLVRSMRAGQVDAIILVGVNPVFDAPAELNFLEALRGVENSIHIGLHLDETGRASRWHIPRSHFLEAWGDGRAYDGTLSIIQPLIAPLYDTRSEIELLNVLATGQDLPGYDLVRQQWAGYIGGDQEEGWRRVLHDGFLANSGFGNARFTTNTSPQEPRPPGGTGPGGVQTQPVPEAASDTPAQPGLSQAAGPQAGDTTAAAADGTDTATVAAPVAAGADQIEVVFHLDPKVLDGTFANNAWMQELPDPTTKLVWDNVAIMSPATAERLGVEVRYHKGRYDVDKVEIAVGDRSVRIPAWIQPGVADDSIHLYLGYGREIESTRPPRKARFFDLDHYTDVYAGGPLANAVGVNVGPLRSAAFERVAVGRVQKVDERYMLSTTQEHGWMEGRPLFRMGTLEEFRAEPEFAEKEVPLLTGGEPWQDYPELWDESHPAKQPAYQDARYFRNQWAMVIDLNTCTGCNACVVACNSENNIPMVGKEEVGRGREMHWLRIDRYFVSSDDAPDEPKMVMQPIPCMHCEDAPCESVCPVAATMHSADGTNQMIYNRCIGTRYCSNNCPYKVRRFNFFNWAKTIPHSVQMAHNPDVTVRSRGIMEKCSYCVQRIREVQRTANIEERVIRDGEVMTACQQACPADAIVFGDMNDLTSAVNRMRANSLRYEMLAELSTKPRTSYLARVTNPNPNVTA